MKNKVLLFALLLSFATSCIFDDTNSPVEEAGDTYLSLKSSQIMLPSDQTGVNMESITIESLRIMVFSKATGQVVTNKVFDIANLNLATKDPVSGYWIIDFSNIVVATKPGPSIVYVVLNENIMSISGQTLTGALNAIPNITGMKTLVDTPLSYIHPLRVVYDTNEKPIEPPFIMSTFDEFDIPPNMPKSNPYVADLRGPSETKKGFELDRTMAKVTLDSISSYPRYTGETTDNKQTSYIFILKVGLVNVPTQYLWSPNRLQTTPPANPTYTVPVPPYTGSFQTLDFGLENTATGYYDRTWNGSITATAYANVTWYKTGSGKVYKIKKAAGKGSYGTNEAEAYAYDDKIPNPITSVVNSGNFIDYMNTIFTQGGTTGFDFSDVEFSNDTIIPTIKPAYWKLQKEKISYYVPEHILAVKTNSENATKLHVKAVIAGLPDFSTQVPEFDVDNIIWNGDWQFPDLTDTYIQSQLKSAPHPTITGKWMYYWDISNFIGTRKGTISQYLGTIDFDVTNSNKIKDFYLPIQNTPTNPVDYNIYRNHEYKFSVHALEQWTPTVRNAVSGTANNGNDTTGSMVLRFNDH